MLPALAEFDEGRRLVLCSPQPQPSFYLSLGPIEPLGQAHHLLVIPLAVPRKCFL